MATIDGSNIKKLIVACDAGMGSSVMLASTLKKQLAKTGVTVDHSPVDHVPADADIIVCHQGLAQRARAASPGKPIVPFQVFIGDPAVTRIVNAVKNGSDVDV